MLSSFGTVNSSMSRGIPMTPPPNLLFDFENNLNNTGSGVGISSISYTGSLTYVTTPSIKGIYSAFTTQNNVNISWTLANPTFPISYSFWVYVPSTQNCDGLISVGNMYVALGGAGSVVANDPRNNGTGVNELLTFYSSTFASYTDNLKFYSTAGYQNTSGVVVPINTWVHVAWVANTSTSWTVYVNKVPYNIDATANPLSFASSVSCNIGPGKRNGFYGNLDSFQLYNGYALTQNDVNNIYNYNSADGNNNIPLGIQLINHVAIPFSSTNTTSVTVNNLQYYYLNGTYNISASSVSASNNYVYYAFQTYGGTGSTNSTYFWSSSTEYTGSGNPTIKSNCINGVNLAFTGTAPSNTIIGYGSNPYYGVWIQISFPYSFICKKFIQSGRASQTTTVNYNFMLVGSNDGINFTLINNYTANTTLTFTGTLTSNTTAYSYYRLIIGAFSGADNSPSVQYFWLYT